jgi:hypothetical protein
MLIEPMSKHILPLLKNENCIPKVDGVYSFQRRLYKSDTKDILNMGELQGYEELDFMKCLLVELFVGFVKLYQKCISRFYTGEIFESLTQVLSIGDLSRFEYLYEFPEGIYIRTHVINIYREIFIFFPNHLINDRLKHNKDPALSNCELTIPMSHRQGSNIEKLILKEMRSVDLYKDITSDLAENKEGENLSAKYIFKTLFPLIYKYVKGMITLYSKDDYLIDVHKKISDIFDLLHQKMGVIMKMIGKKLDEKTAVILNLISNADVSLMFQNLSMEGKAKTSDTGSNLEQDEILYPKLLELRKKGAMILGQIDGFYDSELEGKYTH